MANSITSLRAIAQMEWRSFVEGQSRMEAVLRTDPSGFYPRMTFATRDRYRHVVERIARRTRRTEEAVARIAIECTIAGPARRRAATRRRAHVGYYLIDEGLALLEARTGYRPAPGRGAWSAGCGATPASCSWAAWSRRPSRPSRRSSGSAGRSPGRNGCCCSCPGFILANDIAVSVVNQLVSAFLPPRTLPKLDLHGARRPAGVPDRGGHPDPVRERRGGARGAGQPRGAVPRQPGGAPALRGAERLHRLGHRDPRRRRRDRRGRDRRGPRPQRPLRAGNPGRLLSLPSSPPLESARGRVDGMGAETGQAGGVQPLRAGRRRRGRSR